MIYFDNAATTINKPESVAKAVCDAMCKAGNASRGAGETSLCAMRIIEDARDKVSRLFNLKDSSRVIFTSNATESLNTVIKGILNPKDRVITTACEHNSVLRPLYEMKDNGCELIIIPADAKGNIDYSQFANEMGYNTKAVICTHASNVTGNIIDIETIGKLCHERGILFIVDASQTAGIIPIDMEKMNVDILCFTGHKGMLGPQGTGGICIATDTYIRPLKSGGTGFDSYNSRQPDAFPAHLEAGTMNTPGIAGIGAAVEYILNKGIDSIYFYEKNLMSRFYDGIKNINGLKIYGDWDTDERIPVVSVNIGDEDSSYVSDVLMNRYGIVTRPGAHCAPLIHRALNNELQGTVRFSFSHFNTIEEVEYAINAMGEIAGEII